MTYRITEKIALVVVDPQIDFFEGGALAVSGSNTVLSTIQNYLDRFECLHQPIFITRDWHPENHCSFKTQQGMWPPHCIQNTRGAEFHPNLKIPKSTVIISKADQQQKDAYSGFDGTDLNQELKNRHVIQIAVCGLATDYCVKHTVLDGRKLGYEVFLLTDGIKGVDLKPTDSTRAIREMEKAGSKKITFGDFK